MQAETAYNQRDILYNRIGFRFPDKIRKTHQI